jgi:hypothetical protein
MKSTEAVRQAQAAKAEARGALLVEQSHDRAQVQAQFLIVPES